MDRTCLSAVLVVLFSTPSLCNFDDPFVIFPLDQGPIIQPQPLEFRAAPYRPVTRSAISTSQRKPILHTEGVSGAVQPAAPPIPTATETISPKARNATFTISEFVEALTELFGDEENERQSLSRAAGRDYEGPALPPYSTYSPGPASAQYAPYVRPYPQELPRPNYGPYPAPAPAPAYHEPATHIAPVNHVGKKLSVLESILKPTSVKAASKVSGFIGFILALLTGSSPEDGEIKGLKDLIINGIVKPLLLAKGGLKALISKMTIPVISLLLINVEILITVWWLWEDCEPAYQAPVYSYRPPPHHYNPYK